MASSFSAISTALTALYAQRRGLDVTAQNIANANTVGYTRQRVDLQAIGGATVPALWSSWNGPGSGVDVSEVTRLRDVFLEARALTEHAQDAYLADRHVIYNSIEQIFAEPSDTSLQSQLSEFWAAWHDVANNPGDGAARTQLIQRGSVLADGLHAAHDNLSELWSTTRTQVDGFVAEVNSDAAEVADLNQAILRATSAGLTANELIDQRDVLVQRLVQKIGATAVNKPDGVVQVLVGGSELVGGAHLRQISSAGATRLADQAGDPVRLRWADSGVAVEVSGGQLAASLDTLSSIVPGYASQLDAVTANLATEVNNRHLAGYDLDGNTGQAFFGGTTADTLAVVITDPRQVAASATAGGNLDGSNADDLAGVGLLATGPDRQYRQLVVGLGVSAQTAERRATIQARLTADLDGSRESASGVNLDEEMTNMVSYQRAYEAASRLLTAVDEALDVLINRTGLVGR